MSESLKAHCLFEGRNETEGTVNVELFTVLSHVCAKVDEIDLRERKRLESIKHPAQSVMLDIGTVSKESKGINRNDSALITVESSKSGNDSTCNDDNEWELMEENHNQDAVNAESISLNRWIPARSKVGSSSDEMSNFSSTYCRVGNEISADDKRLLFTSSQSLPSLQTDIPIIVKRFRSGPIRYAVRRVVTMKRKLSLRKMMNSNDKIPTSPTDTEPTTSPHTISSSSTSVSFAEEEEIEEDEVELLFSGHKHMFYDNCRSSFESFPSLYEDNDEASSDQSNNSVGSSIPIIDEIEKVRQHQRVEPIFIEKIMNSMEVTLPFFFDKQMRLRRNQKLSKISSVCSEPLGSDFQVRGETYTNDHIKIESDVPMFALLGVDHLRNGNEQKKGNLMLNSCSRPLSYYERLKKKCHDVGIVAPFLLVINFVLPWGNFISYFYRSEGTNSGPYVEGHEEIHSERLWKEFLTGNKDYRNNRLKFIPRVIAGPWMVKKMVGSKPAIIGKKIPTTYYGSEGDNYLEVCLNVAGGGAAANSIANACIGAADSLTVDLGFLIEGKNYEELPEQLLNVLRVHHIPAKKSPTIDQWEDELGAKGDDFH